MTTLVNGTRNAEIKTRKDGHFVAFIGFTDEDFASGMSVVDVRTYKSEDRAMKFAKAWLKG